MEWVILGVLYNIPFDVNLNTCTITLTKSITHPCTQYKDERQMQLCDH